MFASSLTPCFLLFGVMFLGFTFTAKCVSTSAIEVPSDPILIDSQECDAIVRILAKRIANQSILEEDWIQLFSSDGYSLVKKWSSRGRREFNEDKFKEFVLSDSLSGQLQGLTTTLEKLKKINVKWAVDRASAYLPESTKIRAKIYFLIKPIANSFVLKDSLSNPSIGIYVDPTASIDIFENRLVHELFHVGYDYNYFGTTKEQMFAHGVLSRERVQAFRMFGKLSEGFAMLAAAGGPDIHPHAFSKADERARWDNDMRNVDSDLKRIDRFFNDIIDDKLTDDQIDQTDSSFSGYQGPWYTVGWRVATTIERSYGRGRLIQSICDPTTLFSTYNEAAKRSNLSNTEPVALWSSTLIERIAK
jgi:hypothetical protein